jgi:hypothetical protein
MQLPMPKTVRISLWLLVGSTLAGPLLSLIDPTPLPEFPSAPWAFLVFFLAFLAVIVWIAVMAYRRRNWARWVHSIFFVLGLALVFSMPAENFPASPVMSSLNFVVGVAEVVSIVLLFVPQSNAWYSAAVPGASQAAV